jgi:hypothetical protein
VQADPLEAHRPPDRLLEIHDHHLIRKQGASCGIDSQVIVYIDNLYPDRSDQYVKRLQE